MNHESLQNLMRRLHEAIGRSHGNDPGRHVFFRNQAEVLTDPALVEEIKEYLATGPSDEDRQNCYLLLGRMGRNLRGRDCAKALLESLSAEMSELPLLYLLGAIDEVGIPEDVEFSKLIDCLDDRRALVRQPAIRALGKAPLGSAEESILSLLARTEDPSDVCNCQRTLGRIGTEKSIHALERNLNSNNNNVKGSAEFAISRIRKRAETAKPIAAGGNL
jgi:HEAT repeat protein